MSRINFLYRAKPTQANNVCASTFQSLLSPVKFTPPDFKNNIFGWVRPDGAINFTTEEEAMEFGKRWILKALNRPNAYERGVAGHKNTIYDMAEGKSYLVRFNKRKTSKIDNGGWDMHGHPKSMLCEKETTGPHSPADWRSLMLSKNIKTSIVYNSKGEYCKMEKIQDVKDLKKTKLINFADILFKPIEFITNPIAKVIFMIIFKTKNTVINSTATSINVKKMAKQVDKYIDKKTTNKLAEDLHKKVYSTNDETLFAAQKYTDEYLHEFWTQNQKKYGIKYSSNYAQFREI